jgi:hypothetical protein
MVATGVNLVEMALQEQGIWLIKYLMQVIHQVEFS